MLKGWCCSVVRTNLGSLNKNHAGFRDFWLIVFTHSSKHFCSDLSSTIVFTLCLFATRLKPSDSANRPAALSCLRPVRSASVLIRCSQRLRAMLYSVACSSIWNYHSHCSVFKVRLPTLLRSDFSIQIPLGTEIRSQRPGGPKWTRTTDLTIISRVL